MKRPKESWFDYNYLAKKIGILGLTVASFLPISIAARGQENYSYTNQKRESVDYVPGELIVKFKEIPRISGIETKFDSVNKLNDEYKAKSYNDLFILKEGPEFKKFQRLTLGEKVDILDAMEAYSKDPYINWAEPNYTRKSNFTPNDEFYGWQWAYEVIEAERGWDIERGNSVITIIDTGVKVDHPDLEPNMLEGYDYIEEVPHSFFVDGRERIPGEDYMTPDNDPSDFDGHGTAMAGTSAAKGNNGIGVSGGCPNCLMMPLRAGFAYLKNAKKENIMLVSAVANSIVHAADYGADVANMSFGGSSESRTENFAIDYAKGKGLVLVAPVGNNGENFIEYPASNENVIAVAGTDRLDNRHPISNYGERIDVAAPIAHFTTTNSDEERPFIPRGYSMSIGTSVSSALVAAEAGLIKSINPSLSPDEVREIIKRGVDEFGVDIPEPDKYIGTGRVNVYKALELASSWSPEPRFIRGDSNSDNRVDISDVGFTLDCLFGEKVPDCLDALDANDDGMIDISDPVRTLLHLFYEGMQIPEPFPEKGTDPTSDNLRCSN